MNSHTRCGLTFPYLMCAWRAETRRLSHLPRAPASKIHLCLPTATRAVAKRLRRLQPLPAKLADLATSAMRTMQASLPQVPLHRL